MSLIIRLFRLLDLINSRKIKERKRCDMLKFCRVRVANELGAGNGKGAEFATVVAVVQSTVIGVIFCIVIMIFHDKIGSIFTSSIAVKEEVNNLSFLLAVTILLNSVQPVLSGKLSQDS